jgi:hypothetical protein
MFGTDLKDVGTDLRTVNEKTTHWLSELSMKLKIINTSLEFVAAF